MEGSGPSKPGRDPTASAAGPARLSFGMKLIKHLLTHALGRHIEAEDRFDIDNIMKSVEDDGYLFRDIVVAVVTSDLFARP